jgi:predicted amidohydrolase
MYDYSGRLLTQLTDQEAVVTLRLDHADQQAFRQKLNFLADRDHFLIQPSN